MIFYRHRACFDRWQRRGTLTNTDNNTSPNAKLKDYPFTQSVFDLIQLIPDNGMAWKYELDLEEVTSGLEELSLPVTVLSWNIFGPGKADARRKMIHSVVSCIDPDVMLLQETKDSVIRPKRVLLQLSILDKYKSAEAGDREEAQVFYKENIFEEVFGSTVTFELNSILEEMFPGDETRQLRSGSGPAKVVSDRTCVVHLRHKLTEREIIFISYHNIRKGGAVRTKASEFCEIIAKLHESTKCCVVAGVDFNCSVFDSTDVTVPHYEVTLRRQETNKKKIDYFILSDNPPMDCVVEAFDLFSQNEEAPFYRILQDLLLLHTKEEYKNANDHDPLTLSMEIR